VPLNTDDSGYRAAVRVAATVVVEKTVSRDQAQLSQQRLKTCTEYEKTNTARPKNPLHEIPTLMIFFAIGSPYQILLPQSCLNLHSFLLNSFPGVENYYITHVVNVKNSREDFLLFDTSRYTFLLNIVRRIFFV
jgi:hypothetical protein